jgi:SAM-dependent methyltransferase
MADFSISERLRARRIVPPTGRTARLLEKFGAQIGEIGWHVGHPDETMDAVSDTHAQSICLAAKHIKCGQPRILEVGAYLHHSAQIAAARLGGTSVAHDISAASLKVGYARGCERGFGREHVTVAGDFHDLPFSNDSFDISFIASAVHHTWEPWIVLNEMVRVTRPGGLIIVENEPVGRESSLYHFRGNREEQRTDFENALEARGLTRIVSSPFPGSRAEALFGIIENDRISLPVFERSLLACGVALEWSLSTESLIGTFDKWLVAGGRSISEIADRLSTLIGEAALAFGERDRACGFTVPSSDQIWPLAYKIFDATERGLNSERERAQFFGAALRAVVQKKGKAGRSEALLRRELRIEDGVYIDDLAADEYSIRLTNVLPDPEHGDYGPDWCVMSEQSGFTLANLKPDCVLHLPSGTGFLVLRVYSVAADTPYAFSVMRNEELVYSHYVAGAESHLGKIYVNDGDQITIHHHDKEGSPLDLPLHSRLTPKFVPA